MTLDDFEGPYREPGLPTGPNIDRLDPTTERRVHALFAAISWHSSTSGMSAAPNMMAALGAVTRGEQPEQGTMAPSDEAVLSSARAFDGFLEGREPEPAPG